MRIIYYKNVCDFLIKIILLSLCLTNLIGGKFDKRFKEIKYIGKARQIKNPLK